MSALAATPLTARPQPRHKHSRTGHHMHVYRAANHCWLWDCPCGGGIHDTTQSLPTQHAAFVAALNHSTRTPGG